MRCPRILLADDAPEVRALLSLVLSKAGADVRLAENGIEALAEVQRADAADTPFDAILLDMGMPELDGWATAAQLRARGCQAPILAVTAHGERDDIDRCRHAGCDEVLVKPVRPETLIAVVALRLASGVEAGEFGFERSVLSARGVREGVEQLSARFAERLPERARALEGALAAGDVAEVSALAHRLKGTAGAYGFDGVAEAAAALQADVAARVRLDQVRDQVARVAELCRRASTARLPIWRYGAASR